MTHGSPAALVAIGASFLLLAGYFWGAAVNRRIRRVTLRWIRDGLRDLPRDPTVYSYGSAGLVIRLPTPRPGIEDLQLTVLLTPREMTPLWLWHKLRHQPDMLVLRALLPAPLRADLEVVARTSAFGRAAMRALTASEGWAVVDRGPLFTTAARRTRDAATLARDLLGALQPSLPGLVQISLRRGNRVLQVASPLPSPTTPLAPALDALAEAARRLQPPAGDPPRSPAARQ